MLVELAKEANISQSKVNDIINHYETKWSSEREKQEADKRKRDEELQHQQEIENKKHEAERKKQERLEWWENNKKTIHIAGISILGILSVILFFSEVYIWAAVSFGLSYGLLAVKAHQEEWLMPLLKWTGIILGGLTGAAILFGLGYLIYENWETILTVIGVVVVLGIVGAIFFKD